MATKPGDKLTDLTQDGEMIEVTQNARLGEMVELAFDHQRSTCGGDATSQQSSSVAVTVVADEVYTEQDISDRYELMAKQSFEQALIDSFYQNNFALFDILLEQWNKIIRQWRLKFLIYNNAVN